MSAPQDMVERGAFAIYRQFIRGGFGTRKYKCDELGQVVDKETPDEAAQRRWCEMSEISRQRFRDEATAMLEVV